MTDNDFLGLVSNEFDFCISSEEIQLYKKAILTVAKKLKVEDKKCKEIIKNRNNCIFSHKREYEYINLLFYLSSNFNTLINAFCGISTLPT